MDNIEELLPGLEEFLAGTLASEGLSSFAEDRRQFFLERLDIVKLPPSVPPREGRSLPTELLKEVEETSGTSACCREPDFAATQREISRSFLDASTSQDLVTSGPSLGKEVKVYDDIDLPDSRQQEHSLQEQDYSRQRAASQDSASRSVDGSNEDGDGNSLYEIPVSRPQLSTEDNNPSYGTDGSSLATMGSTEELPDDVPEARSLSPPRIPTPQAPRKDITDTGSRDSIEVDARPPELPFRPPLPKRNEIYSTTDKSGLSETEKSITSDPELSVDADSTSYESFEDDNDQLDNDKANTFQVKLPKKPQKKSTLRRGRKQGKSCSPSRWEITVPFRKLSNIEISGELFHRGKLKWNRRIGAISNGCLVMYKPEKNARPLLVVPLVGYEASVSEREGKKGYEVKMVHPEEDDHTFSVDFKEWALHWIEHINGNSKKQPPAKYHTHLARSYSEGADCSLSATTDGSKNDLTGSNSNVSTEGGSLENSKDNRKKKKIMRVGSFAYRASQFFESLGKRTTVGRKPRDTSVPGFRHSSGDTLEVSVCAMQSSNSAGNLTKELLSPASDSSTTSVFSGSNRGSSLPPTPCDTDAPTGKPWENEAVHVTYKGHLSVFSSFNKRCWGRRWCQVRENMFECYRTDSSQDCELCFHLRPCVLRHAVLETNSDNGLMILEAGREKITVDTLSKSEMLQWVRVLFKETTNEGIPEGLEEFLEQKEDYGPHDGSSFCPYRNYSSHDYEDPDETIAAAARLKASSQDKCETAFVHTTGQDENESCPSVKGVPEVIQDILPLSSACKQTTDSGFYSVRGANSDSDSSWEIASPRDHPGSSGKLAVDSVQNSRNRSLLSNASVDLPNQSGSLSSGSHHPLPPSTSPRLIHPTSGMSSQSPNSYHRGHVHRQKVISTKRNSNSASTVSKSGSSTSSNKTVILSTGEEYSVILKRSERSSKTHSLSAGTSNTVPGNSHPRTSDIMPDDVFAENDEGVDSENTSEHLSSLANSSNAPTFCESAGRQTSIHVKTSTTLTLSTNVEADTPDKNISKNQLAASDDDQPPPLPNSPVPKLRADKIKGTLSSPPDGKKSKSDNKSLPARAPRRAEQKPEANDGLSSVTNKLKEVPAIANTEGDAPASPISDIITVLISQPDTTPGEIRQVIDSLKIGQADNKRRRMAVHEKRQRVLSDEERLACEKEFAALEKVGESTERNIRVLQNHLDIMQGQTMEAMKSAHLKQTSGSKKKGKSRKMFSKADHS